jgi:hypothetical protein
MQAITIIGLDIAKPVFQVHCVDAEGRAVLRCPLKRRYVLAFFNKLPPCLIGIKSKGGIKPFEFIRRPQSSRDDPLLIQDQPIPLKCDGRHCGGPAAVRNIAPGSPLNQQERTCHTKYSRTTKSIW